MSYVLTYVAADPNSPVTPELLKAAEELLGKGNIMPTCAPVWLSEGQAVDIGISEQASKELIARLQALFSEPKIDVFINPIDGRQKKLLLADMDSTIVTTETLDELAAFADLKEEISAITEEAMEGNIDFKTAVRERVELLKDLPITALEKTLEATELTPGAKRLVHTMSKHSAYCVLVSGGFTFFTEDIARRVRFHTHHGNELEIRDDLLTGRAVEPIEDKFAKLEYLKHYANDLKITLEDAMSIGDGANDLPMLEAAGLGIGYKPKDIVYRSIDNIIIHGDLSAALYAQGYTDQHIVE